VVEQHAHPHSTVCRTENPFRQDDPCGIHLPDIVLNVYGLLGLVRKAGTGTETPLSRR